MCTPILDQPPGPGAAREDPVPEDDFVFRFRIAPPPVYGDDALERFYRESLLDLLKVVRFYARGVPVVVDAFAFLDRPDEPIPLGRTWSEPDPAVGEQSVKPADPGVGHARRSP